jgi:hypothetical protein
MKNPSRADAPEGFADLSIFFPGTILRAEHLHAYADRADWRCAHTSARRTTAVGGVRADMSLSTYDVTISCDTHSISPRENQSARVYRGPCRARHRFQARSRTLPLRKDHEPPHRYCLSTAPDAPASGSGRRRCGPLRLAIRFADGCWSAGWCGSASGSSARLVAKMGVRHQHQIAAAIWLLDGGATVPFVAG